MGLGPAEALPPAELAEHRGVCFRLADTLVPMAALAAPEKLQPGCFSACTLPWPNGPVVVVKPLNCAGRQQSEADHLGATLLLPRPLVVAAHARGLTIAAIADTYGVSEQLARWRVNATGVSRYKSTAGR